MATTLQQKQISVLTMNTLAFAVNFAVWTMFSIIGIRIKQQLNLNETEFGLLVATPILTGSLVRLPLGILTDRFGGRIVFFIQMILVAIPIYGLAFATQYWQYLTLGLFVGLAGGSFATGIAYTSAWFSKERQGTAMGIFGAGNAGSAITNLVAPLLVVTYGCGRVQRLGGPVEEIRPGDVVWIPPGEKHWHGAAPTTAMTHIAIQEKLDGSAVEWLEQVTEEEYLADPVAR